MMMALTANCHRDSKKRSKPFTPADFLPQEEPEVIPAPITALKALITKGKQRGNHH